MTTDKSKSEHFHNFDYILIYGRKAALRSDLTQNPFCHAKNEMINKSAIYTDPTKCTALLLMAWPLGWFWYALKSIEKHWECRAYRSWKSANRFYYMFALNSQTVSVGKKKNTHMAEKVHAVFTHKTVNFCCRDYGFGLKAATLFSRAISIALSFASIDFDDWPLVVCMRVAFQR